MPGYNPTTATHFIDPFPDEKPLYSVTAENLARYESLLSSGTQALVKNRAGYRIDVYPTHRSVRYPAWVLQNSQKNATTAKTVGDIEGDAIAGADSGNLPYAGVPFPIPKSGYEVMWNHAIHYSAAVSMLTGSSMTVDANGTPSEPTVAANYWIYPWYDRSVSVR